MDSDGAGVIGILTTDVRLYYDMVKLLKTTELQYKMLNFDDPVPTDVGVILTSSDEYDDIDFEPKIAVDDIEIGLRKARLALCGLSSEETVIVGVDPGPKPGIAIICSGLIIETKRAQSPEHAADLIIRILEDYSFSKSILRIGHGSPEHRDRILSLISNYFSQVDIIDESRTSTKSHTTHIDAAITIARHRKR